MPRCLQCGYILFGLTSRRCPECGWDIDWKLARASKEQRRPGTPAHRTTGWARLPATAATVLMMLFWPSRFARCLRWDEPLRPALWVAVIAGCIAAMPELDHIDGDCIDAAFFYATAITVCIACNSLGFTAISRSGPGRLTPAGRCRFFLLVSLYSTCFIAAWGWLGPPQLRNWSHATFLWPLDDLAANLNRLPVDGEFLARTAVYYWWILILWTVAAIRIRPRWAVLFFLPVPLVASFLGYFAFVCLL